MGYNISYGDNKSVDRYSSNGNKKNNANFNFNNRVEVEEFDFYEKKAVDREIVKAVLNGDMGVGEYRKTKLEEFGYDYQEVQNVVDKIVLEGMDINSIQSINDIKD